MNEISLTAGLSVFKPGIMGSAIGRSIFDGRFSMSGNFTSAQSMSVNTTPTPIDLGNVSTPHWAWFQNMDSINTIYIANGFDGLFFLELLPGEPSLVALYSLCTPYAASSDTACQMEYLIISL